LSALPALVFGAVFGVVLFLHVSRGVDEATGLSTELESDSESESLESESDPDVESDPELTTAGLTSFVTGFWDAPVGFVVLLEGRSDSDSELELD